MDVESKANIRRLAKAGATPMAQSHASQPSQSLANISIFAELSSDALAPLEKRCRWRHYQAAETIVDYLDSSDDVFFIVSGEARVSIYSAEGKAITFSDLRSGDVFGEIAAIDGHPRSATIEARTRCIVASMTGLAFRELLQSNTNVGWAVQRYFVAKIRTLTTRVYEFSALAVSNRVQAEILRLAKLAPSDGRGACIDLAPTHAEIASRVSSHREAVTREINRLSRLGIIERRGRALIVNDVEHLATMVREATGE